MNNRLRRTVLLALIALALFSNLNAVSAYTYYNYNRMEGGISSGHYSIQAPVTTVYNGTTYYIMRAFNSGFQTWNNNSIANLTSGSSSGAKVIAYSMNDTDQEDLLGKCVWYQGTTRMDIPYQNWTKAYIFLNIHAIDHHGLSETEYRAVAAHEIGHAFGLSHDTGQASLMDSGFDPHPAFLTNGWYTPQSDDIRGVERLYEL